MARNGGMQADIVLKEKLRVEKELCLDPKATGSAISITLSKLEHKGPQSPPSQ